MSLKSENFDAAELKLEAEKAAAALAVETRLVAGEEDSLAAVVTGVAGVVELEEAAAL